MMYKVGIVDDTDELLDDYKVRLKREAIELIVAPEGSMGDIKEWIVQEKIKSILIDYQLSSKYLMGQNWHFIWKMRCRECRILY